MIRLVSWGTDQWQEKYNACTRIETAYSEEKGRHSLANPMVRGLNNVKICTYLVLWAQIINRIRATGKDTLARPHATPSLIRV
jgi:hypothetical protein